MREPTPKIRIRFRNTKTQVSSGSEFGMSSRELLWHEIDELRDSEGSFIDVENYLKNKCRITFADSRYCVSTERGEEVFLAEEPATIRGWMSNFLKPF